MKKFAALLCALVHLGFSMVEARLGAATSSHLVVQHSQIEDAKRRVLLNFAIEYKPEENQKTSSHNHASKHDKDEKEATDSSGPDSNTENSSNTTSNSNGDMCSEPSREGEAAPSGSGATTGETVTKSPSSGGISAGAAVGIAVGGIVAAAGAFLAGRRTRTTASPDVPVTVHKPNSASTVNVQSATDLDVPSISNDATDSPSKRDDV